MIETIDFCSCTLFLAMSVHALTAWVFEILIFAQIYLYSSYINTKVHKSQAIEIKYNNTEAEFLVVCDPSMNERRAT